ncbi:hypothetical protein RI367_004111 [Sorochytrium milnesiophthora]
MFSRRGLFFNEPDHAFFHDYNSLLDDMENHMTRRMNVLFAPFESRANNAGLLQSAQSQQGQGQLKGKAEEQQQQQQQHQQLQRTGGDYAAPLSLFRQLGQFNRFRLDVTETEKEFTVHADLPGIPKENVNITIDDDLLTISAERKDDREQKDAERHIVERSYGKFQRTLRLPHNVDQENAKAAFDNGVLTLTLGKKPEQEQGRRIEIH